MEVTPRPTGLGPVGMFAVVAALSLASFAGAVLVLSGAGRVPSVEPRATATPPSAVAPTAGRTVATATAAGAGGTRVVSATGRSRPIGNGAQHEVTFVWTLDGARENDAVVLQFYAGTRSLGQQRGNLDPSVFAFSTGTLTLVATLDCSTGGWSAEILTIRGQPIQGDSEATVPPVRCP